MAAARRDFQPIATPQSDFLIIQQHGAFPFQHKEELPRPAVMMPDLIRAGRHALLDHAAVRAFQEVPAVTAISPCIMLCIGG